tara:strand:- start:475 stop:840 length:366 start_codon:yes stop_codon:yes gene_type:complete
MSSEEISIKQLPAITEINNNDLILVQTPTATNTLKFEDFVIGLENTTFAPSICANATNIDFVSATLDDVFFTPAQLPDGPNLLTNNTTSQTLSTFDTFALPIEITSEGTRKTYYFLLSGTP